MSDPASHNDFTSPANIPLGHSATASLASSNNAVSMPFIKRHVTRRLKAAKQECDKELEGLTHAITTFFEDKLREGEATRELMSDSTTNLDDSDRESRRTGRALSRSQDPDMDMDHESSGDEEGYDADPESVRHSRQASLSSSPTSLRRQRTFPRDTSRPSLKHIPGETSPLKHSNTSDSSIQLPLLPPQQPTGPNARRFSRSINMPAVPSHSAASSRSTSRSRSPMPASRAILSDSTSSRMAALAYRRASRILVDDPIDPFMLNLHSIIALCTDIIDMPLSSLTNSPDACGELVQKVQHIGQTWDDHPDWHGRAWYVQLLLTVAGLSRVVEWWEAEKQFWNFDDDEGAATPGEDERVEPLTFVLKPSEDNDRELLVSKSAPHDDSGSQKSSDDRPSRDEQQKQLGSAIINGTQTALDDCPDGAVSEPPSPHDSLLEDAEHLQEKIYRAQSLNIVMELALDGDSLIWVNDAWKTVTGTEPDEVINGSLASLLTPADADVFTRASATLQSNDSSTVEVEFRLRLQLEGVDPMYRSMEGKGMIMLDRLDGSPTHSMWVIKPLADPEPQTPRRDIFNLDGDPSRRRMFASQFSAVEVLCRICDCQVPQWFFERHSETCHETHKLEADIGECNDSIAELRATVRDLSTLIEKGSSPQPEYRGTPILAVASSGYKSGPLQLFRPPLGKLHRMNVKKLQRRLLEQLDDILLVAAEISIPSLKENESAEPIERQRLLSPSSERKISTVRMWNKPAPEDPALAKLVKDVDTLMRAKLDSVVRMQNTVRYAEKVRQECEEKMRELVSAEENHASDDEHSIGGSNDSRLASEPGLGEDSDGLVSSANPTPIAPSPVVAATSHEQIFSLSNIYHRRSPKPLSNPSPLASQVPLVPPSPPQQLLPPPAFDPSLKRSSQLFDEPSSLSSHGDSTSLHRRHSSISQKQPALTIPSAMSPKITSMPPSSRATPSSIKDFEVIKPISKGAFGSVFLAKKKVTGDYYAIKVLKKSDMIAKNQITNVKAERMILMKQGESPFVVKLFWTFQSRDNLYLVMEYLNGGDCAVLIKTIGSLPEEWARNYIAEVILGLEYLHERGVTHRDLKPDNLLIDQHGHLKLTDFGLSRIGLLGRQARDPNMPEANGNSRPASGDSMNPASPIFNADLQPASYFLRGGSSPQTIPHQIRPSAVLDDVDSSGSEGLSGAFMMKRNSRIAESPLQSFASELVTDLRSHVVPGNSTPQGDHKVVGTPDYLAPETILGISKDDRMVDWWALGVITYEFLYGFPPFHADTPDKVFENILSGRLDWHEQYFDTSDQAKHFVTRLTQADPSKRLGSGGPDEVKAHPFLSGIVWDQITSQEAQFIPQVTDPESTDYFDARGAIPQLFQDEDPNLQPSSPPESGGTATSPMSAPIKVMHRDHTHSPSSTSDDFGTFSFKNLGVLKQANDDVIRKLKTEQLPPLTQPFTDPNTHRRRSLSQRIRKLPAVQTGSDPRQSQANPPTNPPSPSTSASSIASSPSYSSIGPSTPGSLGGHSRRISEYGPLERFKLNHMDVERRGSMPSRLRTASVSSTDPASVSDHWSSPLMRHPPFTSSSESSTESSVRRRSSAASSNDRSVTVLIAEDNPISAKILETLLTRMGCRCVVVSDGSEAISVANGDIRFDVIMLDLNMPIVDGEAAAQYIKNTKSKNTQTPIVCVSAYTGLDSQGPGHLFTASLAKPVQKTELLSAMRNLGFKTTTLTSGKK